ncbi:MAG TPA: flagellar motor protein [Myxococcaceae bacterium]|nr:flagellar motor protein [Myxococcaceae bacterium]
MLFGISAGAGAQPLALSDPSQFEGLLTGRVCRDLNGDGRCGEDEPGQPGVRLVLATGLEVRTDRSGRFDVAGLPASHPQVETVAGATFSRARSRLKIDVRSLPAELQAPLDGITFEVPMSGLVRLDVPLRVVGTEARAGSLSPVAGVAPDVSWDERGLRYGFSGQVEPGSRVQVQGETVEVGADGRFTTPVEVEVGANPVALSVARAEGMVQFFTRNIEVLDRQGQLLFVPGPFVEIGQLLLPGPRDAVAAGRATLSLRLPPGTHASIGNARAVADAAGQALLPIEVGAGAAAFMLELRLPDGNVRTERVELQGVLRPFSVGLLELEAGWSPTTGRFQALGRGQTHAELAFGPWRLSGELAFNQRDLEALSKEGAVSVFMPRRPERFERALDPDWTLSVPGATSAVLTPNPAEGRLRLLLEHDALGELGMGTHRFVLDGSEVGRVHRPMFGPHLRVETPLAGQLSIHGEVAGDLGLGDPLRGLGTRRMHEVLRATGGSLYLLRAPGIVEGSEQVRIEVRDGVTGLPLAERHLVRGRDYELDARAGRILLARPLSFLAGPLPLSALPFTVEPEPVLAVDYAVLELGREASTSIGGEVGATFHGAGVGVGGIVERAGYRLMRGVASVPLGPLGLTLEAARSEGQALEPGAFAQSDDGGLTSRSRSVGVDARGEALTARLRGETFGSGGWLDASFRVRTPGYSDDRHADLVRFRQAALRWMQPLGPVQVVLLGDDREGMVEGGMAAGLAYRGRTLGGSVGWSGERLEVRGEVRDEQLALEGLDGGRLAAGASVRYRLHERLSVLAQHRHVLSQRGEGPGAVDDTFSAVGADLHLDQGTRFGLRAGYGHELGPLIWVSGERGEGRETFYSSVSTDVDGPDVGTIRSVTGARTQVAAGSQVFIEDVAAHDAGTVRASRAIGAYQQLGGGWDAFIRYEQGVRDPLGTVSALSRSAGSLGVSYVGERVRMSARAELWGQGGLHEAMAAEARRQALLTLAFQARLSEQWRASGRLHAADSTLEERRAGRFVEGHVGLAWFAGAWTVAGRYAVHYERPPEGRPSTRPRLLQTISLLPAWDLTERFTLGGGLHLGVASAEARTDRILSGSLRPALRVVGALEVAAEVAARTQAPDGESLWAVRTEAAWRMARQGRLALGYTVVGYSGLGLPGESLGEDRIYLRGELAW